MSMEDGWIEWKGGECPVAARAKVDVRFRLGAPAAYHGERAKAWDWKHRGGHGDIIAYRLAALEGEG